MSGYYIDLKNINKDNILNDIKDCIKGVVGKENLDQNCGFIKRSLRFYGFFEDSVLVNGGDFTILGNCVVLFLGLCDGEPSVSHTDYKNTPKQVCDTYGNTKELKPNRNESASDVVNSVIENAYKF